MATKRTLAELNRHITSLTERLEQKAREVRALVSDGDVVGAIDAISKITAKLAAAIAERDELLLADVIPINPGEREDEDLPELVLCDYCQEELEYIEGTGWVTVRSGDAGGSYDFCEAAPGADSDMDSAKHQPRNVR